MINTERDKTIEIGFSKKMTHYHKVFADSLEKGLKDGSLYGIIINYRIFLVLNFQTNMRPFFSATQPFLCLYITFKKVIKIGTKS